MKDIINIIMIFAILTSVFILLIPINAILKILIVAVTIIFIILNYAGKKNN